MAHTPHTSEAQHTTNAQHSIDVPLLLAGLESGMPLRLVLKSLGITETQIQSLPQDVTNKISLLQYKNVMARYAALTRAAEAGDSKAAAMLLERDQLSSSDFKATPLVTLNINTLIQEAQKLAAEPDTVPGIEVSPLEE